jgi:glutaredoxin-like YruB-family protein
MEKEKKIIVYSSPDCAYCYTLKGYLENQGKEYEEINIYEDEQARKKMEELSGQTSVPVTVIGDEVIVGWNKEKINNLLGI